MKLFVEVREATWPSTGTSAQNVSRSEENLRSKQGLVPWPLLAKPLAITFGSSAIGILVRMSREMQ